MRRYPLFALALGLAAHPLSAMATAPDPLGTHTSTRPAAKDGADDAIQLARAKAIAQTKAEIEALLERFGGVDEILYELEPFIEEVEYVMEEQRDNGARTFGKNGNHFSKGISEAAILPEWELPVAGTTAVDVIIDFDRKLRAHGVDLIVCPVPSKIEAYASDFETEVPAGMPIAIPRLLETLRLLEAGVEVVDLLPTLLAAKTDDNAIPVYERSGHHISGLGVRRVAELIQERLERYDLEGHDPERFSDEQRTATERVSRSVAMQAWPVLDRGQPYEHVPDSEIVVMGDSHAFAYLTASWACQTARCAGIPITDISVSSGAATAHKRLASQGAQALEKRRVIIWVITSVAFTRPWDATEIPERATIPGLIVSGAIDEALAAVRANEGEITGLGIRESELDDLGKELIQEPDTRQKGIEVLEVNTIAFPNSAEAFFSLANAYLMVEEQEKAGINLAKTIALNPPDSLRRNAIRLMKQLDADYEPPEMHILSEAAMQALVGEYALTAGAQGFVRIEGDELLLEYVGQPVLTLQPLSDLRFTTEPGFLIEFTPGADGEPMQVSFSGRGQVIEGTRIQ